MFWINDIMFIYYGILIIVMRKEHGIQLQTMFFAII